MSMILNAPIWPLSTFLVASTALSCFLCVAETFCCAGLIQNDTEEIVKLVENLVSDNIRGQCLILVTLPMSGKYNHRPTVLALAC